VWRVVAEKRSKQWICAAVISYQLNDQGAKARSLFSKTTSDFSKCLFAFFLGVILMMIDTHRQDLTPVRSFLSSSFSPLRDLIALPSIFLEKTGALWTSKQALVRENQVLMRQQLLLREQLQHAQGLRQENLQLRSLLKLSEVTGRKTMAARVLSFDVGPARRAMLLDKGRREHVLVGQPVLSEHGLVGQVVEVEENFSTVLLISDSLSAVPVKNNRTGEIGILAGDDDDQELILLHLPKTSAVMVNDLLVTSGLGGRYPEGYPVGRVSRILNKPGEHFIDVYVSPVALLQQSHWVLLISPQKYHSLVYSSSHWSNQYLRGKA
jgi:rod shape-determining protein MreC